MNRGLEFFGQARKSSDKGCPLTVVGYRTPTLLRQNFALKISLGGGLQPIMLPKTHSVPNQRAISA